MATIEWFEIFWTEISSNMKITYNLKKTFDFFLLKISIAFLFFIVPLGIPISFLILKPLFRWKYGPQNTGNAFVNLSMCRMSWSIKFMWQYNSPSYSQKINPIISCLFHNAIFNWERLWFGLKWTLFSLNIKNICSLATVTVLVERTRRW
jgi:hypothetical protein